MLLAKLVVDGVSIRPKVLYAIPKGIVGATIELYFNSPEWQYLKKTVVFQGHVTKDVLDAGTTVEIPSEVVAETDCWLSVGVYGTDEENNVVIPTLWCNLGPVVEATDPSGDTSTNPLLPVWAQVLKKIGNLDNLYTKARDNLVAAINEILKSDYATKLWVKEGYQPKGKYLTEYKETDPTVPPWAKNPEKPSYSKADVGLGDVDNVRQYSADNPPPYPVFSVNGKTGAVTLNAAAVGARPNTWIPTAEQVGALPSTYIPPDQTAEQVGADPAGTASAAVSEHNTADDSHNDIRLELKAINDRLTAFFDSDEQTLDELSEIVAYITSNKALIDSITTSKVSVADIINNLTTNVSNKPLSAAQGVVLKGLVDAVSGNLANYQPKGNYALESNLPEYAKLKYAVADTVQNSEAVTVIEDTGASVTASDNSAYFNAQNIVVERDTYKLGKEAMISLQHKRLTGNGSVAWKDWDTQTQGWKDSETNHGANAPICTAKLKARYADDPVYLSMKLPSEANFSTDTVLRAGMRESNGSGTYVKVDNMGATYAVDYTALPDDVVICIGHMSIYTLSREENAVWKLHDKQVRPTGQSMYYLPWDKCGGKNTGISSSKITAKDDHARYALKKSDFAPDTSVSACLAKCLHFWAAHNHLDLAQNRAVLCFYETWTETPGAVGNLYTAIGCDQKSEDGTKITQNFWGRNVLLKTEKIVAIGHNISDSLYDELRDTPNDPRRVYADYLSSFSSEYDSKTAVTKHNSDANAHPDIREEIDTHMGDMQRRINAVSEVVKPVEVITPSLNLNDGEYEPGYFNEAGAEYVGSYSKQSFRNANYIPVQGGRKVTVYYDKAEWNNNNAGINPFIVQYDSSKNVIVQRANMSTYTANKNGFALNANTAFVRLAFHKWADITTPLTDIKMALYYLEDARLEFVEYGFGSEMLYGVFGTDVHLAMPDGTTEQLPNVIDTLAKKTDLSPMVDEALAIAKASGDFKGDKGDTGATGSTGATGAQGIQGYSFVTSVSRPSFTEAQWTTYGEIGRSENWSGSSTVRNGCRVGDIFTVVGTATDTKHAHVLYFRCETASGDMRGTCIAHSIAERGAAGASGTNATITNVTAEVDNNVGTPSAEVEVGGTASDRTFHFKFKNLKGNPGEGSTGGTGTPGAQGPRGFGILKITTAPSSYTTATGGFTPTYRVALSTVKSQSKAAEVLVGDTILYSYYTYPVGYVDASYVYLGTRTSIRGATGAAYTLTDADKNTIVAAVIAALPDASGVGF